MPRNFQLQLKAPRHRFVLVFLAAVLASSIASTQPAPGAGPAGTWEGQLLLRGNWRYMEADFGDGSRSAGAKVDLPQERREFRDFTVQGQRLQWTLVRGQERIRFDGVVSGDVIRGQAEQSGVTGEFQLVRVARAASSDDGHLAATYEASSGSLFTVARFDFGDGIDRLAFLDVRGGHWGTLIPTGRDRYVFAPARSGRFPIDLRVAFERADDGRPRALVMSVAGADPVTARRADRYDTSDVTFSNGGIMLAGTVVRPRSQGRHPTVVMVHSSGHQSRNGPIAYFRLIANVLASNGIATLVYDKRGVGMSTGSWTTASFADLAGDVVAAVDAMRREPGVDADRIGLWGLSQGGWVAPVAAVEDTRIAFLALVSAAATTPAQQEIDRVRLVMVAAGAPPAQVEAASRYVTTFFDVVAGRRPWDVLQAALAGTASEPWLQYVPRPRSERELVWTPAPATLDPVPLLRQLAVPILAVHGADDVDVPAFTSSSLFAKHALHPASRQLVLDRADHYMLQAIADPDREYRRLSSQYLPTLVDWIRQTPASRPGGPAAAQTPRR